MARSRLRKKDRVRLAGKGNNKAQYKTGKPKPKFIGNKGNK